jgi:hypothetical protein
MRPGNARDLPAGRPPASPQQFFCSIRKDDNGTSTLSGGSGHLNTATLGVHSYTVTALSGDEQSVGASITDAVVPAPTPAPAVKPPVQKGAPTANHKTGEITRIRVPGAASAIGVQAKKGKRHAQCKRGFVRKGKRCVNNAPVKYGVRRLRFRPPVSMRFT